MTRRAVMILSSLGAFGALLSASFPSRFGE